MKKVICLLLVMLSIFSVVSGYAMAEGEQPVAQPIDVDLTVLSSTMVFGEVYNMLVEPERYLGKVIKMKGTYATSYSEELNTRYHFVLIADAAACCQQGLEFMWSGDHRYPEDYPEDGTYIEVAGVYSVYEEAGISYYYVATEEVAI